MCTGAPFPLTFKAAQHEFTRALRSRLGKTTDLCHLSQPSPQPKVHRHCPTLTDTFTARNDSENPSDCHGSLLVLNPRNLVNYPGSDAKSAGRPFLQRATAERCQKQACENMTAVCNRAAGNEDTDLPRFWLASCLMRLNCFFMFSPLQLLWSSRRGEVNGASVRKRSSTGAAALRRGHRGPEKRPPESFTRPQKKRKAEKRLLDLHGSKRQPLFADSAPPVWEEGGSAFTSLLCRARPRDDM